MAGDKYSAVWVSHSSIGDFRKCPRLYYLRNVYKDRSTGKKIALITPSLALGQAVHETLEGLSYLPVASRFDRPLWERFDAAWQKVSGEKGGFWNREQELRFKKRGEEMIGRVARHPGPLQNKAVKIKEDLPRYWLSEKDNIILCGKIDWLEYLPETDSVHIIDFKTGRGTEEIGSLQLPIYHLLVHNCQKRRVGRISYWYLNHSDALDSQPLPDLEKSYQKVLAIALKMKLARQLKRFACPQGKDGCRECRPFEQILRGEATKVGVSTFGDTVYMLPRPAYEEMADSEIL